MPQTYEVAPDTKGASFERVCGMASPGDTLVVRPGTYQLSQICVVNRLRIIGTGGPQAVTVNGSLNIVGNSYIENIKVISQKEQNCLIINGSDNQLHVTINGCIFKSREALYPLIYAKNSVLTISHCSFYSDIFNNSISSVKSHIAIEKSDLGKVESEDSYIEFTDCYLARLVSIKNSRICANRLAFRDIYRDRTLASIGPNSGVEIDYLHLNEATSGARFFNIISSLLKVKQVIHNGKAYLEVNSSPHDSTVITGLEVIRSEVPDKKYWFPEETPITDVAAGLRQGESVVVPKGEHRPPIVNRIPKNVKKSSVKLAPKFTPVFVWMLKI